MGKMEDNISKYELLFVKEIEGTLSVSERAELEEWLQYPQNKIVYEEQKKLWASIDDLKKMKTIDTEKALKKVEARLFSRFSISFLKKMERVAAILFIPLLLSAIWLFYNSYFSRRFVNQQVYNTIEVPLGTKSQVSLPDGTHVWLNAGSTLKYPLPFDASIRHVELDGEGYFEVTKDKNRPFVVFTSGIDIKVLGTSFNCNAYSNDEKIETALVEGQVEISGKSGDDKFMMEPGDLAVFSKKENTIKKSHADLDKYIAWKSGKLMFRDDPMIKVIEKLGRWYSVKFQVDDPEILSYVYSATFPNESLDRILEMLKISAPLLDFQLLPREELDNKEYGPQIIKLTKKPKEKE